MDQLDKKDNADLDKIDRDINFHRIMVFLILVTAIIFYMIFINLKVTESAQSWGPVGDFFGGILNPIFALFAFYWLTYSVRLQIKELKETRVELGKATQAQKESAAHQKEIARLEEQNLQLQEQTFHSQIESNKAQQQQIAIQNFESLFFQLLKSKTDAISDIRVGSQSSFLEIRNSNFEDKILHGQQIVKYSFEKKLQSMIDGNVQGKESIKQHVILFKTNVLESWESFYTKVFLDYAGNYFRISYQIVKLIDQHEVLSTLPKVDGKTYSKKQKEYFDIFRSTFNQYELEAFFFNCLSKYGNSPFKKLLEKYGMFEPLMMEHEESTKRFHTLARYAYQYDVSIFEKNKVWLEYFENVENILSCDLEQLCIEMYILYKNGYIEFPGDINDSKEYKEKMSTMNWLNILEGYVNFTKGHFWITVNTDIKNNIESKVGLISPKIEENEFERSQDEIKRLEKDIEELNCISHLKEIAFLIENNIRLKELIDFKKERNSHCLAVDNNVVEISDLKYRTTMLQQLIDFRKYTEEKRA